MLPIVLVICGVRTSFIDTILSAQRQHGEEVQTVVIICDTPHSVDLISRLSSRFSTPAYPSSPNCARSISEFFTCFPSGPVANASIVRRENIYSAVSFWSCKVQRICVQYYLLNRKFILDNMCSAAVISCKLAAACHVFRDRTAEPPEKQEKRYDQEIQHRGLCPHFRG